jgi:hypothetical protein
MRKQEPQARIQDSGFRIQEIRVRRLETEVSGGKLYWNRERIVGGAAGSAPDS